MIPPWSLQEWTAFIVAFGAMALLMGVWAFLHMMLFEGLPIVSRNLKRSPTVPVWREDWLIENDLGRYCPTCEWVQVITVDGYCTKCGGS